MDNFTKIVCPGNLEGHSLFCKITFQDGKLSISGVHGPRKGGNCYGGCGQIDMRFAHRNPADNDRRCSKPTQPEEFDFAPGWNRELWLDFLDIWKQWHLNDMRAGCEHQRAQGWGKGEIEVVTYQLTSQACQDRRDIQEDALNLLKTLGEAALPDDQRVLLAAPYETHTPPDADSPLSGCYEVKNRETKLAGWTYPSEHPGGVLTKPCPVCGYKYGSTWLREEVPATVLAFLSNLPATDAAPAWC